MQTSAVEAIHAPEPGPGAAAPAPEVLESAAAIAAIEDRPIELLLVPEWRGAVHVRALSSSDRDSLEAETLEEPKPGQPQKVQVRYQDFRARLAVRGIVTRSGERLFQDADWPQLAAKSAAALDRICTALSRLSRISQQDVDALVGESAAARPSASPTA